MQLTDTSVSTTDRYHRLPPSAPSRKAAFWASIQDRMLERFTIENWAIGIVNAPIHAFLDDAFVPTVHWLGNCGPLDFLADCFGIVEEDSRTIVAERFTYRGSSKLYMDGGECTLPGRGYITSIVIDSDGKIVSETPAIDTGFHISYPCTIHDGNAWYLVAEELSADRVNLFRRDSEGRWRHLKELLPHAVVDPTVFTYAGQWWMFGTTRENTSSELQIWCADELQGEWRPHPANPVRRDPQKVRSGGTPFVFHGQLYRPSQNSTRTYGGSIIINRVDVLTRQRFEEHCVQEVFPPPASQFQAGIHTLSAFGNSTLIDARRPLLLPRIVAKRMLRKLATWVG